MLPSYHRVESTTKLSNEGKSVFLFYSATLTCLCRFDIHTGNVNADIDKPTWMWCSSWVSSVQNNGERSAINQQVSIILISSREY